MKTSFGNIVTGEQAYLYTISGGGLTATITDYGAHLVSLLVPNRDGVAEDVVLGFDNADAYRTANGGFLGAIVGRNANRICGSTFLLGDTRVRLTSNEGPTICTAVPTISIPVSGRLKSTPQTPLRCA